MTERPILFSGPMVRAILAGKKTQTRRVVHFPPYDPSDEGLDIQVALGNCKCPYGQPGDVLWVRETWQALKRVGYESMTDYGPERDEAIEVCDPKDPTAELAYRATGGGSTDLADMPWRPSIHMPRWASRLSLLIKSVRVERLQDISEADAQAEGVECYDNVGCYTCGMPQPCGCHDPQPGYRDTFVSLWDSINGKTYPWASNPWVRVLEFEVQA